MSNFRALPNLRATSTFACEPWNWAPERPVARELRENKKLRDGWITDPLTRHCVYSAVEGLNENERVTRPKGGTEGNPPHLIHGYVADYDKLRALDQATIVNIAKAATYPPTHYEVTLSGWARFVWLFEAPVRVSGWKMALEFNRRVTKLIGADGLLPGFDPKSEEPQQYFTNSGTWIHIGGAPLSHNMLVGALADTVNSCKGLEGAPGPKIPFDDIRTALGEKYPEFSLWEGEFAPGAQGPSFWVPGSASPKSAVVKDDGIYTFSGHATQVFYSWADLLGKSWVDRYEGENLGRLVADIYYDPKVNKYYWPIGNRTWLPLNAHDLGQQLVTKRGADNRADKSGTSIITRAICHIQTEQWIRGCVPFVFMPPGLVTVGPSKERFLNSAKNVPVDPAEEPQRWGPSGGFPFISRLLDALFGGDLEQRDHFLSELSYFYTWSWKRQPRPGHFSILAGGVGVGKSFLVNVVIGNLMGGCIDAAQFLLGLDTFTAPYLHYGVWTADDVAQSDSQSARNYMSAIMKRVVANTAFLYNEKFGAQVRVEWNGRGFMTTNLDEESIRAVPEITSSNADKFCLYRLSDEVTPGLFDADRNLNEGNVKTELRAFARFLLDWQIPDQLTGDRRFGLKSYLNRFVLNKARANADSSFLTELIDDWRREWFKSPEGRTSPVWQGTTTQLLRQLAGREIGGSPLLRVTPHQAAAHLRRMSSTSVESGSPMVTAHHTMDAEHNIRLWNVHRPHDLPAEPKPPAPPAVNSQPACERFQR